MSRRRPPEVFYRVEWDEGFGWPECERQEHTSRNFTDLRTAALQIEVIRALPTHHRLTAVYVGHTTWEEADADEWFDAARRDGGEDPGDPDRPEAGRVGGDE